MAEERVTYLIEEQGGGRTAASFDRVAGSMKSASVNSEAASKHFANLGGAVGNVGTVVSQVNPQLGAFAGVIGTAGSAVSALTSSLGGPLGLVAGGAVAALGIFVTKQKLAADAANEATKELEAQRQTVAQLTSEFAKFGKTQSEASLQAIQFQLQDPEGKLRPGERRRLEVLQQIQSERVADERLRAEQEADRRELAQALANEDVPGESRGGARVFGSARSNAQLARLDELQKRTQQEIQALEQMRKLVSDDLQKRTQQEMQILEQMHKLEVEGKKASVDAFIDEERRKTDAFRRELDEQTKAYNRQSDEVERRTHERQQIMFSGFQIIGQAGINAFADMAKGQKVALKEILSGIGDQMVAEGSKWFFTGLGRTLLGDPTGGALMALGGAEIGFGIGLGAVTAGATGAGGGGNRTQARPAEPTRFRTSNERTETQVVNVQVNTMVADANAGKRIKQAIRESDRIHGSAA